MLIKGNNLIKKDIRNILLIQLGDIGDVVLSFPAIRALRENFPLANLMVAVWEKAGELIEDCPWASGVVLINNDKRRWLQEIAYQKEFFSRLRKVSFGLAIDLRTENRGAILALLSGARQRIGSYADDGNLWRSKCFTHLCAPAFKPGQYVADRYLAILTTYNIITESIFPKIEIPPEKQQSASALLREEGIQSDRPVMAIQPFSLWQYKEWGMDKYLRLIKWISSEYKFSVIITGSHDERARANEITKVCGQNVYNFAGKTSIGMFAAVLKICNLFIGGDSAGMHIAAAVGTPTVSIFGPSYSDDWAPRGNQHCIVQKKMSCVPCSVKGCQGSGVSRCLEELSADEVIPIVKEQIDRLSISP